MREQEEGLLERVGDRYRFFKCDVKFFLALRPLARLRIKSSVVLRHQIKQRGVSGRVVTQI